MSAQIITPARLTTERPLPRLPSRSAAECFRTFAK